MSHRESYSRVNVIRVNGAWDVVIVGVWFYVSQGLLVNKYYSLKNIKKISSTGIDRVSVGAITHSAKSFDTSLVLN